MTRTAVACLVAPFAAVLALGGCSLLPPEPTVGVGQLVVSDLENPTQVGHFTGPAVAMTARLDVTSTGCVYVVVDGVQRYPFWPAGTTVAEVPDRLGTYVVDVPGVTTLSTGDAFEAVGVVDDTTEPFVQDSLPAMLLGFCAIEGAPVAFFDAESITPVTE